VRVLFLDLDGVLNAGHGPLDPDCVARLNRIIDATGAVIVVHSMWRYSVHPRALSWRLEDYGVTADVVGCTPIVPPWAGEFPGESLEDPRLTSPSQGEAIRLWLADHPGVTAWVVLDDQPIDTPSRHTIRTVSAGGALGLTDEHAERAIAILGGAA